MRICIQVVATMVLALGATGAKAYDGVGNGSTTRVRFVVKFDDLDLDRQDDAKIMLKRIEQAASKACGGHASFSSLTGGLERGFYECREEAIRQAVTQLRAPRVAQLFQQASKQDLRRQP